ncbi:MAG: beta-hydroxyacyl-ACP dehydratase [Bacteriovoracaceae bacterium]|nr:beta-hydroxyacyl-ACP dehydratase [Bacteriovoracaceae bacterium]
MLYTKNDVLSFLPHRDPFLFVDSIESVEFPNPTWVNENRNPEAKELLGGLVIGHYFLKPEHPILQGHFPGRPIFPGVLQIECMAQVSSFLTCEMNKNLPLEQLKIEVALLGADKAKFRSPVLPGDHLKIKSKLVKVRSLIMNYESEIYRNEELVSEVTFLASIKFLF